MLNYEKDLKAIYFRQNGQLLSGTSLEILSKNQGFSEQSSLRKLPITIIAKEFLGVQAKALSTKEL